MSHPRAPAPEWAVPVVSPRVVVPAPYRGAGRPTLTVGPSRPGGDRGRPGVTLAASHATILPDGAWPVREPPSDG
jgi:hypothetical protein